MYNWHQDFGTGVSRKLSNVVQLSDPSEYEGGNLQIMTNSGVQRIRKKRGLAVAFPSFTFHTVTPVTAGTRQSLVAWVSGAPFR
jgi:PKHD-type hydroxylase